MSPRVPTFFEKNAGTILTGLLVVGSWGINYGTLVQGQSNQGRQIAEVKADQVETKRIVADTREQLARIAGRLENQNPTPRVHSTIAQTELQNCISKP